MIQRVTEGGNEESWIPIQTEHGEYHRKWHKSVNDGALNGSIEMR